MLSHRHFRPSLVGIRLSKAHGRLTAEAKAYADKVLKEDKRAVFTAAAKASEAAKYLAKFSAEVVHVA